MDRSNPWIVKILDLPLIKNLIDLAKRIHLPGFEGLSVYEVIGFLIKGLQESSLTMRASAMSFKFFLAVFPGIIFLFTLIAYIPIQDMHSDILNYLKDVLPKDAYSVTVDTIQDLLKNKNSGLLSFGFLVTIYLASNAIHAMMESFNESFHVSESRNPFVLRLLSLALLFILTLLLALSSVLIVFSEIIINWMGSFSIVPDQLTLMLLELGKWLVVLLTFNSGISLIYFLGPDKKAKFRFFSAGSAFSTLFIVLTSLGFAYYVNHFGQYNKVYGSIGTIMVIMLWIYFNSLVMILGFELNATIFNAKRIKIE
jgi:membrane protein